MKAKKKAAKKMALEPIEVGDMVPVSGQMSVTPITPIQAAMQSGASPEELLKFMELQERWEANEARKAYIAAMAKFRAACPTIEKTEKGYNDKKHPSLAGIMRQIKSIMSENGLSHSWETTQDDRGITVTCCVTHIQGHHECTSLTAEPDMTGSKNDIQAIGSTVTYLERYTLTARLGLASGDPDDDGNGAGKQIELITEEQALELHARATEHEVLDGFMKWLKTQKIDSIDDIHAANWELMNKRLDSAIRAKEQ